MNAAVLELGPVLSDPLVSDHNGSPAAELHSRRLCHDIRHELATVAMLASAAEFDGVMLPQTRLRLQQIGQQMQRITELLARIDDPAPVPAPVRPADVASCVRGVAEVARLCTSTALLVDTAQDLLGAVNPLELRRAVANLVGNAVRAAGSEGTVHVRARRAGSGVAVSVGDSGPGFGTRRPVASGLGLGIVAAFARGCRGDLSFGTSELGGAEVTLRFPAPVPTFAG